MGSKKVVARTLEDLGFRRVASLGDPKADFVSKVAKKGFLETQNSDGELWLRVKDRDSLARRVPVVQIDACLEAASARDQGALTKVNRGLDRQGFEFLTRRSPTPEFLARLIDPKHRKSNLQLATDLKMLTSHAQPAELPDLLQSVILPQFFHRFPRGNVVFLSSRPEYFERLSYLRLGAFYELNSDFVNDKSFSGMQMMQAAQHSTDPQIDLPLRIVLAAARPRIHGFVASRVNSAVVFIPGHERALRQGGRRQSWSALDLSDLGLFDTELEGDPTRGFFHRKEFGRTPRTAFYDGRDILPITRWVIERWDSVLHEFLDPTNFPSAPQGGTVSFSACYDSILTLHRALMTCIHMLGAQSPLVAKMLAFQLLDQLASLRCGKSDAEEFRRMLTGDEHERLVRSLDMSVPWMMNLAEAIGSSSNELVEAVMRGVWRTEAITAAGVAVRFRNQRQVVPRDRYCALVIREMRNTWHGYSFSEERRRESGTNSPRVLEIYKGGVPEELVDVALFQVLLLLAAPQAFLGRSFWMGQYPRRD